MDGSMNVDETIEAWLAELEAGGQTVDMHKVREIVGKLKDSDRKILAILDHDTKAFLGWSRHFKHHLKFSITYVRKQIRAEARTARIKEREAKLFK